MRKIMFFAAGMLLALSLGSCDKSDDYSPSAKRLLPSKIVSTEGNANPSSPYIRINTWQFEYDSENRISKLTVESVNKGGYHGLGKWTFSYEGDNITVNETTFAISYVRNGSIIEIRNDRQLLEQKIIIDGQLRSTSYSYDENGNVKYHNGTLSYDNRNGVFKYVNMPAWYLTDILETNLTKQNLYNNCVECLTGQGSGHGFEINYNKDDYPVEIYRFPINIIGSGTESYEIEYIKAN